MNYVISLSDGTDFDEISLGGKAKNLSNLINIGMNVPSGFCLTSEAFLAHCETNGIKKLYEEFLTLESHNPQRIKILAKIRKTILTSEMSSNFENAIRKAWGEMDLPPIAVRSSCVGEDSYDKSYAGIFSSYLHITTLQGLLQAIRNVWKSVFSEQAIYYRQEDTFPLMAVVIQEMIEGEYSGVLFSQNPISPELNTMVVEGSRESRAIVDGFDPDIRFELSRSEDIENEYSLIPPFKSLFKTARKLERLLSYPIDMEWAIRGDDTYILQVRPLRVEVKDSYSGNMKFCSLDDRASSEKLELKRHGYEDFWIRFINKKYWIRKKAREIGANHYAEFFIQFTPEQVVEANENLKAIELDSEYLVLRSPGMKFSQKYYHRNTFIDAMRQIINENPNQSEYLIQVGEFIPVEIAGFSTQLHDGNIYIEYAPGLPSGINTSEFSPSQVIVDRLGTVVHEEMKSFPEIYIFDEAEMEKVKVSNPTNQPCVLDSSLISEIINATLEYSKSLQEPRLEWYFYKNKFYIKDLSMENNPVYFSSNLGLIMSAGFAEGNILLLNETDIDFLDELGENLNVSVISRSEKEDEFTIEEHDHKNHEVINRLSEVSSVIVVATRPSTGFVPFLDNIKGFIFNQGSLLSHLGIVLREKRIPALISKEATQIYRNGEFVSFSSETGITKY